MKNAHTVTVRDHIGGHSGTWDRDRNVRRAKCGRCTTPIAAGQGRACNEFLSDGYRTVTRCLCPGCETGYAATRREFASLPGPDGAPQSTR